MTRLSGTCDPDDEPPATVVLTRKDGSPGEPGELIWQDTGSGPGQEIWVPDPEPEP